MTEDPISGAKAGTQDVVAADLTSAKSPEAEAVTGDFSQFGLSRELLQAITETGYQKPTPIQAKGIPPALQRRDLIGIAQTGTGKTASFALPMIELLSRGRARARMPRSLILEPTRELAAQVAESFEKYTKYHKLSMALLIGGTSFDVQDRKLDRGADVLIATPGRLLDHFERGKLMLSQTQILVIDEADRMLDMGFIPDIERICKLIPFTRQTLFYSATMPAEIRRLTEQFLQNPVEVEVSRPATTGENITQTMVDVPSNDWAKREALRRLINGAEDLKNAIVFCNRKHDVDVVARSLKKHGFNAAPLHGDLDQSIRMQTLDAFRSGEVHILVASDVAARGLDIPDVSHVFNFDVPFHSDDYVHRIGRTGRAGRSGATFMLVTPRDEKYVDSIEKLIKQKPEHIVLEGLAESIRERPPRRGRDGRRDRDRGRGRNRDRNRSQTEDTQTMQPKAAEAARSPEPARTAKPTKVKSAPAKKQNRNLPKSQQPFGADLSQLPAFLLRPVPLPKTYTRLPEEEEELAEELREEVREVREERKSDKPRKHSRRRGRKNRSERAADTQPVQKSVEAPAEVKAETPAPTPAPAVETPAVETPVVAAVVEKPAETPVEAKAPVKAEEKAAPKKAAAKKKPARKPRKAAAGKPAKAPKAEVAVEVKAAPEVEAKAPEASVAPEAPVAETEAPVKKATAKKTTKKAPAKKATTKKAATRKATTKKAAAKKVTAKKAATKKATTKKATTKKAATKKATTKKAAAKKVTTKKAATKKATTKKATAKKATAKKTTKKAATRKVAASKTTRKRVTKKAAVSAD